MLLSEHKCATSRARKLNAAAQIISQHIASREPVNRQLVNEAMISAFEAHDTDGAWSQRDSFEALEQGLCHHLLNQTDWCGDPAESLSAAETHMARMPTHTVRSEHQIATQQFSTPLTIAVLVWALAGATKHDLVLEPSAGTGLLAVGAKRADGTLLLNELDPLRAALLGFNYPELPISQHDGAKINVHLSALSPTLILMNPPFSKSAGGQDDHFAAFRHLRAARQLIGAGGRIVAVMPDWFGPEGRNAIPFQQTIGDARLTASLRLPAGAFAKHGTSINVKLIVLDKVSDQPPIVAHDCRTLQEAIAQIANVTPRCGFDDILKLRVGGNHKALAGQGAPFISGLAAPRRSLAPVRAPRIYPKPAPVTYDILEEAAPLGEQSGIYLPYRPSRIVINDAGEHPTDLVESLAMGSITAPKPNYQPLLPDVCVTGRLLSAAQLETIIYAGQAHDSDLPGTFSLDAKSRALVPDAQGKTYRAGYFLGDGTGAGKGRQVAGLILDNWLKGRRKAIWVSKNETLLEDARRDWSALGGIEADIHSLSQWKLGEPISLPEGILFVSYPTLRSGREDATRLDTILKWAGEDFDGVIAFDEAHAMGGVAGGEGSRGPTKGSAQGSAGVTLQNELPRARVVYVSATGATNVNNLAYAVRLGLWGPETAFADREAFISAIHNGGIAAMELVARDLKAQGRYASRALSYAGVEYEVLEHSLTPAQIEIYDAYADGWAIIHQNLEEALGLTDIVDTLENKTLNGMAKGAARSRFESAKQRFFSQTLLSMKLPSLIPAIEAHIADGLAVLVQLVSTSEALLDRTVAALDDDARAELDIELSPRETMIDYLERAFPTRQMETYKDEEGNDRSRPMVDDQGNPVFNQQAIEMRDTLIRDLCALPPIATALDALINHFGPAAISEVTGRSRRLIIQANGSQKLERRSPRMNAAETDAFMQDRKQMLVFSDAGGTGRSYHASLEVTNQRRRVHFLLEPGWRADAAIQGLGRSHRTHQASAPLFRPVTTDCRGERRFISTIARRLDALGALTRGQRQTGGQNLFNPADNLESDYAKESLINWYHLLQKGKLASISFVEFQEVTGLELESLDGGLRDDLPPIQRWLNRILALRIATQNAIFDEFLSLIETRIGKAREAGTLDVGVETIMVEQARQLDNKLLRTDPESGATTHLLSLELIRKRKVTSYEALLQQEQEMRADGRRTGLMINRRSGSVALQVQARSFMAEDGQYIATYRMITPTRRQTITAETLAESHWEPVDRTAFETCWLDIAARERAVLDTDVVHIACGLLLPIWDKFSELDTSVHRIVTPDGTSLLGRIVLPQFLNSFRSHFNLEEDAVHAPATIVATVTAGHAMAVHGPDTLLMKRARVNGQQRLELAGADPKRLDWYCALGCFTEIIQYRTRLFVPTPQAEAIVTAIVLRGG